MSDPFDDPVLGEFDPFNPGSAPAPQVPATPGKTSSDVLADRLKVQLPGGGTLSLFSAEEVQLWDTAMDRYITEHHIESHNDMLLIGAALSQQLSLYRAQQLLNGRQPEFNAQGEPTGKYKSQKTTPEQGKAAQKQMLDAAGEIREIEKTLGLDKKSRDAGGGQSVAAYVMALKAAAREYGIHLSERLTRAEAVFMEARWKIRLLENGDDEDRAQHDITHETIVEWLKGELEELELLDKQFAKEKGKIFVGQKT